MKHFPFFLLTIFMITSLHGIDHYEYLTKKDVRYEKVFRDVKFKMRDNERREYKKANPNAPKKLK